MTLLPYEIKFGGVQPHYEQLLFDSEETRLCFLEHLRSEELSIKAQIVFDIWPSLPFEGEKNLIPPFEQYYIIKMKNMRISEAVLKTIKEHLKEGSTILEFGSGEGTQNLSEYYDVISIEEDDKWVNRYQSTYLHAEIKDEWYDVDKVNMFLKDKSYDAILIDGPANGRRERILELIKSKELELNTDVHIFMDDLERDSDMKLAEKLSSFLNRKLLTYSPTEETNVNHGYIIKENEND